MKSISVIPFHFLLAGLFCLAPLGSTAQKELDSILSANTNTIFEEPDLVINIGNEIFEEASEPQTKIKALMLVSNAYLSKRDNTKSLEYVLKAREYLGEISSVQTRIKVLNIIGMQHQQLGIYDKAIDYLDEALLLSKTKSNPDSIPALLGYNYTIRGFIYREQMSCEIALGYFDKAIAQFEKLRDNPAMVANLSTLTYNKGNCFLQLTQIDSARTNFIKSIDFAESVGANSLYAFAKKGLGEVFTAEGNYIQAIEELKEAEHASDKVGDLILNQSIYKNLSDNYLALNNRELYKEYLTRSSAIQEEITKKERLTINNSIQDLIRESERQNDAALSEIRTVQWILVLLIVMAIFFFAKVVISSRKRLKRSQEEMRSLKT